MNRTILIVICDFLLVSLLAFSTVDINKVADEGSQRQVRVEIATNQVDSGKDLSAVMRQALNEERKSRDLLLGELSRARETATRQAAQLSEREKQVQATQQALQEREQESTRLQQQQARLQQQYASAQTNIQALNQQLRAGSVEAMLSKERASTLDAEVRRQAEQAAALRQQIASLAQSNQVVMAEKQRLAGQLQVAEVEKRHATEQVTRMQEEVKIEREEKARLTQQATKLAEGVKVLASKSGELATEIRENRPLSPNAIFDEFITNRVQARFLASRPGLFGEASKVKETETVLVNDGTNTFALCHVQDTPLTLWNPGVDWQGLTGNLGRGTARTSIRSLSFFLRDPRVVFMPVSQAEAEQLGGKIYRVSPTPFKFQDAVLVGAREGYYGECRFEIDPATPDYVRLDRNVLKGLFGKFNPSRGDLVFSKTGELLGVMANSSYCLMLRDFSPAATFRFGQDVTDQRTGFILSRLYGMVAELPFKLQ